MALPVTLEYGWCSIVETQSPNAIISQPPIGKVVSKIGIVSSVLDSGDNLVSVGQYVWWNVNETNRQFIYGVNVYNIIREKDILMIETPLS